ncbi:MAG: MurR/RpiR family transcriptional regulator [Turicibacter sp.]
MLELVGLLGCYNTYDQGDIYFQISKAILENYNDLDMSSLQSFTDSLHISVSTSNRFIKQLYFNNFSDFRNHVNKTAEHYQYDGKYFPSLDDEMINPIEYGKILSDKITEVMAVLDQSCIESLVSMIDQSEDIIFVGIPLTSEVWRLQIELILMGKKTSAFLDPNFQVNEVNQANKNSLVICLHHTRQQDNHNEMLLMHAKEKGAKTVYIGSVKSKIIEHYSDLSIIFKGTNTHLDTTIAQIVLNYIGNYLRNKIINT